MKYLLGTSNALDLARRTDDLGIFFQTPTIFASMFAEAPLPQGFGEVNHAVCVLFLLVRRRTVRNDKVLLSQAFQSQESSLKSLH